MNMYHYEYEENAVINIYDKVNITILFQDLVSTFPADVRIPICLIHSSFHHAMLYPSLLLN